MATRRAALAFLALAGTSAVVAAPARAATVQPFDPGRFAAAQGAGKPILVFIEASWCPTCAKQRPILAALYDTPEFRDLQVFTVDFDTSKALLREMNVRMQSTLVVYHGVTETGRATGVTDPDAIKALLATSMA